MYEILLPIGEANLDPWRSHRLFSACRSFGLHVDPGMTAQAFYDADRARKGWTFYLITSKARDQFTGSTVGCTEGSWPSARRERTLWRWEAEMPRRRSTRAELMQREEKQAQFIAELMLLGADGVAG